MIVSWKKRRYCNILYQNIVDEIFRKYHFLIRECVCLGYTRELIFHYLESDVNLIPGDEKIIIECYDSFKVDVNWSRVITTSRIPFISSASTGISTMTTLLPNAFSTSSLSTLNLENLVCVLSKVRDGSNNTLETNLDVYLAMRGVLLLKRNQHERESLRLFGANYLNQLHSHFFMRLSVQPNQCKVDSRLKIFLQNLRQGMINNDLDFAEAEDTIAAKLMRTSDPFERKILVLWMYWVQNLPSCLIMEDASEATKISRLSQYLTNLLFNVVSKKTNDPPITVSSWSGSQQSLATIARKEKEPVKTKTSAVLHDFRASVLCQQTPTRSSCEGEAKKSNAKSMLYSLNQDLARICVSGRDAVLHACQTGLSTPEHISFQQIDSLIVFYAHLPISLIEQRYHPNQITVALEIARISMGGFWNDPVLPAFIDDDLEKLKLVWAIHQSHSKSLHYLLNFKASNENEQPITPPPLEDVSILNSPQAMKFFVTSQNCHRPSNLIYRSN